MQYKYINVYMTNGESITIRDGSISDTGEDMILFDADRASWWVRADQIRYIKVSKTEENQ